MSARVHPTALVDPGAELGLDVVVEPYAVVKSNVHIGAGTTVGARATVYGHTVVGAGCSIGIGAVIGTDPQDLKYAGEATELVIGDETIIREYVTINRGTSASGRTVVGPRCYLMTYVHIAHDCRLGEGVILSNSVQLGGHVMIGDFVQIGGVTAVHQFVRVGAHAFIGGGSRVPQDVPPFARAAGNPIRMYGVNALGLQRAGFQRDTRVAIKRAYRLLFNSRLRRAEAVEQVRHESGHIPEIAMLLEFLGASERGVMV